MVKTQKYVVYRVTNGFLLNVTTDGKQHSYVITEDDHMKLFAYMMHYMGIDMPEELENDTPEIKN